MGDKGGSQKEVFVLGEGDRYYERNRTKLDVLHGGSPDDAVVRAVTAISVEPRSILEIGCSNGWRLDVLRERYSAACAGIDPSRKAIEDGARSFPGLALRQGTADQLPYPDAGFDLVIFGFCLYLCDRRDLFRIAAEADRVLADEGHLVIFDFHPPFPYQKAYAHCPGVFSYKMDYTGLFTWHPAYTTVHLELFADAPGKSHLPDERMSVAVLRKDPRGAYPNDPFSRKVGD